MLNSSNNKRRHFVYTNPEPTANPDLAALYAEYLRSHPAAQRSAATKQRFWFTLAPATTAAKCSFTMLSFAALFWGCLFLDTTLFSYFPFGALREYHPGLFLCLLAICSLVDQQWFWPHGWSVLSFIHLCAWSILLVLALETGNVGPVVGLLFAQVFVAGHLTLGSLYTLRALRQQQLAFRQQQAKQYRQLPVLSGPYVTSSLPQPARPYQARQNAAHEDMEVLDFPLSNKALRPNTTATSPPPANPTSFLRH